MSGAAAPPAAPCTDRHAGRGLPELGASRPFDISSSPFSTLIKLKLKELTWFGVLVCRCGFLPLPLLHSPRSFAFVSSRFLRRSTRSRCSLGSTPAFFRYVSNFFSFSRLFSVSTVNDTVRPTTAPIPSTEFLRADSGVGVPSIPALHMADTRPVPAGDAPYTCPAQDCPAKVKEPRRDTAVLCHAELRGPVCEEPWKEARP